MLNLLRPTVAVARYLTSAALARHRYPGCRTGIEEGDAQYLEWFAREVRGYYPFFPMTGDRVQEAFAWHGHSFAKDGWVLLDLYGTNHDRRIWNDPEEFRPERVDGWGRSPFNFIAQGGGGFALGHRCPGEWLTIELVKTGARLLASACRGCPPSPQAASS
ncbi:MAG: cytochrome P450 [Noviherbaspirillum sp.]